VTPETKVCESCRAAYYGWRKNNPEFGGILWRVEKESLVDVESDAYESSGNEKHFLKTIVSISPFRFSRVIQ
jgi:hypothetical protein